MTAPEGGAFPARAADVAATPPPEPSLVGWGSVGFSCPPPEEESATPGGRPAPTPGAGTPARATVSWREMFPKMSAGPWEEEGGEVEGGGGARPPPPLYCGHPGYLPAPVLFTRVEGF